MLTGRAGPLKTQESTEDLHTSLLVQSPISLWTIISNPYVWHLAVTILYFIGARMDCIWTPDSEEHVLIGPDRQHSPEVM